MNIPFRIRILVTFGWLICAGCAEMPSSHFEEISSSVAARPLVPPPSAFLPAKVEHPSVEATPQLLAALGPVVPAPSQKEKQVFQAPREKASSKVPEPATVVVQNPKLSPGDVIDVKVYQEDDLTSHVRVNADGTVTLPLLGEVAVGGKTVDEACELIRVALEKDYLYNPHVTLSIAEFAKKRFSVMGEVKAPGFYLIPENEKINVLQALSMAGGYTAFSRGTRIHVKRIVNGKELVLWVDAKAMARDKNVAPLEVLPGDAITVNSNIF